MWGYKDVAMTLMEYPPDREAQPSPTLRTVHAVARVLKEAHRADDGPISFAEIGRRLPAKRVRHATVRACIDELDRLGFVTEGPEGVEWTLAPEDRLADDRYQPL